MRHSLVSGRSPRDDRSDRGVPRWSSAASAVGFDSTHGFSIDTSFSNGQCSSAAPTRRRDRTVRVDYRPDLQPGRGLVNFSANLQRLTAAACCDRGRDEAWYRNYSYSSSSCTLALRAGDGPLVVRADGRLVPATPAWTCGRASDADVAPADESDWSQRRGCDPRHDASLAPSWRCDDRLGPRV